MGTNHIITRYKTIISIPGKSFENGSDERAETLESRSRKQTNLDAEILSHLVLLIRFLGKPQKQWKIATCLGMEQKSLGPFHP